MEDLPALLVHGPYLGVLGVISGAILVVLATRSRAGQRALRAAEEAWPEEPPEGVDGAGSGEARTLVGRLLADDAVARIDGRRGSVAVSAVALERGSVAERGAVAAEGLAIELDGARVTIEGPVACAKGSLERRPGTTLAAHDQAVVSAVRDVLDADGDVDARPRFSSLSSGDRVRAIGVIERRSGGDEEAYREPAGELVLAPGADGVVWLAFDGHPRVRAPEVGRSVALGIVSSLLLAGGLWGLGEQLTDDPAPPPEGEVLDRMPWEGGALRFAALSPWHRDRVASHYAYGLLDVAPFDERLARKRVALQALARGCSAATEAAREHGLEDEAEEIGRACDDDERTGALCDLGRYEDAGPRLLHDRGWRHNSDVVALLAAGDPDGAREIANDLIAQEREVREQVRARQGDLDQLDVVIRGWRCVADAIGAREGEDAALTGLREAAERSRFCRLLLADVTEGAERLPLLRRLEPWESEAEHVLILAAEVDPEEAARRLPRLLPSIGFHTNLRFARLPHAGLRGVLEVLDARELPEPRMRALRGVLRLIEGQELAQLASIDAAETRVRGAIVDLDVALEGLGEQGAGDEEPDVVLLEGLERVRRDGRRWLARLALERGDPERALALLPGSDANDPLRGLIEAYGEPDPSRHVSQTAIEIVEAARSGNGTILARALGSSFPRAHDVEELAPSIVEDREVLAAHLRWARRLPLDACDPGDAIRRFVEEVRWARQLDATEWEARAEERLRAHEGVIRDRDVAMLAWAIASYRYADGEP